jgi:hypothetical protein
MYEYEVRVGDRVLYLPGDAQALYEGEVLEVAGSEMYLKVTYRDPAGSYAMAKDLRAGASEKWIHRGAVREVLLAREPGEARPEGISTATH